MQGKIFISYSRRDIDVVRPIKEKLEADGFSCWMDLEGIESGSDEFTEHLAKAIEGSSVLLFFLSSNSQGSHWSLNELRAARDAKKHVVLVRFNDDSMTIKFRLEFGGADIIDWRDLHQKGKLLRDLKKWAGTSDVRDVPKRSPGAREEEEAFLMMARRFKRNDGTIDEKEKKELDKTALELGLSSARKIKLIEKVESEYDDEIEKTPASDAPSTLKEVESVVEKTGNTIKDKWKRFSQISTEEGAKPKSMILYCILAFFLGFLGCHNFYIGRRKIGCVQLAFFLGILFFCNEENFESLLCVAGIFSSIDCLLYIIKFIKKTEKALAQQRTDG